MRTPSAVGADCITPEGPGMFPRIDAREPTTVAVGTLTLVDPAPSTPPTPPRRGETSCAWCGRPVDEGSSGRRRRYCRRSCRQRAYEQRQSLRARELPEGTVVLSEAESADLMDRMFQLRCACEDLHIAITEEEDTAELRRMSDELVAAARRAERLR